MKGRNNIGTNYYWFKRKLELAEEPSSGLHIGKQSCGWVFHFQAHPNMELESYDDWKNFLKNGYIYDEYGILIPYNELIETIENSKKSNDGKEPYSFYNLPRNDRDPYFDKYYYSNRGLDFTTLDFS